MTRCIHCTRCVRFASEIAGISDLGTTGRGKKTEIGMYVQKFLKSELSGNVIDLCPVGALTSKPFAFSARSWELKSTDTIDLFDSVGSSIVVNTKGNEILRVLPRDNNSLNEEWITDKARFSYDGFKRQRLLKPFVKINKDSSSFSETDWPASFSLLKDKLNFSNSQIGFITGKFADLESLIVAKELLYSYGSSNICDEISFLQNPSNFDFSVNYKFNKTLELVDKSDCCLLINLDTRFESSSLNIRLRRKVLSNELKLGYLGSSLNLTYNSFHLGTSRNDLVRLLEGRHTFSKEIQKANNPLIIFGTSSSDFNFNTISPVMEQFNTVDNLNCVSLTPGLLNSNEMGNYAFDYKNMKVLFLLGADELDISDISEDTFVVYIGSHGDKNIYKADLILPSSCFTEKKGTFLNMEGKLQLTNPSVTKGSLVRDEWKVFRAFSSFINKPFSFKNFNDLSIFFKYFFNFSELFKKNNKKLTIKSSFIQENFKNDFKKPLVKDFFLSDFITRSSLTMHKCSGVLDKTNYQK
jgi:NADH dehydrogenase (ubiquinone) Fe-S protein 1